MSPLLSRMLGVLARTEPGEIGSGFMDLWDAAAAGLDASEARIAAEQLALRRWPKGPAGGAAQ